MEPSDSLVDTLRSQLNELELMHSMYPKTNEFVMDDPTVVADINDYVDGRTAKLPSARLEYRVNLQTTEHGTAFEVSFILPHTYNPSSPSTVLELPELYVRCHRLNRTQQSRINEDAKTTAKEALLRGESCVLAVLQWLQSEQGLDSYSSALDEEMPSEKKPEHNCLRYLDRYWIYSHHIYNKTKRKDILQLANDLDITGFCLPGKPGIICAEGIPSNCAEFWDRIRDMTWKKITCRKIEHEEILGHDRTTELTRRFPRLRELVFEGRRLAGAASGRSDFGAFLAYLEGRNCGHVFKDLFGIDGKLAGDARISDK